MKVTFPSDGFSFIYNQSNDHVVTMKEETKKIVCATPGCDQTFVPYNGKECHSRQCSRNNRNDKTTLVKKTD